MGRADGIVVTPSHNPPEDGGFKYNPPAGGPPDTEVTGWIQERANALLADGLRGVQRIPFERARRAATTRLHDYLGSYVGDLASVVDFEPLRGAGTLLAVDPLGGAGVDYWGAIGERYELALTVVSSEVDPTFRFMTVDWDGRIRMDCSSSYAMQRLIGLQSRFDVAWACDTDHDRHGVVIRSAGLLNPNHYLAVAISYLFQRREGWPATAGIGKTMVSTSLVDRLARKLGRPLLEVRRRAPRRTTCAGSRPRPPGLPERGAVARHAHGARGGGGVHRPLASLHLARAQEEFVMRIVFIGATGQVVESARSLLANGHEVVIVDGVRGG